MSMMPIGVPKVAYRMPGNRGGEWVDIFNRLTRERIIFMGSEIDDEMANQIIGVLLVSYRHRFLYLGKSLIVVFCSIWITRTPTSPSTSTLTALEDLSYLVSLFMILYSTFVLRLSPSIWV
jgi:Clp protease